ncbi:MAG: type 4a pilus biogenesis protein PilO [Pseudomonadota bacterium]
MNQLLEKITDRHLLLALTGIVLLLVVTCFMYLVLPKVKGSNQQQKLLTSLERVEVSDEGLSRQLQDVQQRVRELERELHGDMVNLPAKEMEAYIIGRLQTISWRNQIQLLAVEPKVGAEFEPFQEILFKVQLHGDYHDLYQWLDDAGRELGFVVVKEYAMQPVQTDEAVPNLSATLTMASYRAVDSG